MMRLAVAALIFVGLLASVSPSQAVVTSSSSATPAIDFAGRPITLSWIKTSSSILDGNQAGSIQPTFSGPDSGVMLSKPYSFSGAGQATLTWTFRSPFVGDYTVNFVDTVTSGVGSSQSAAFTLEAGIVMDWNAEITPTGDHGHFLYTLQDVDTEGNVYLADAQKHANDIGYDLIMRSINVMGSVRWVQEQFCGPIDFNPNVCQFADMHFDDGGRIVTLECQTTGTTLKHLEARAYDPANGNNFVLNVMVPGTVPLPSPTKCPTPHDGTSNDMSIKVDATNVAHFVSNFADNKIYRFPTNFDSTTWQTTVATPGTIVGRQGETFGLLYSAGACTTNCPIKAVNLATGVVGTNGYSVPSPGFLPVHRAGANVYAATTNVAATWGSVRIDATTIDPVVTSFPFDVGQVRVGDTVYPTNQGKMDLDGANSLIVCGTYTVGSVAKPIVAIYSGLGVLQTWLNPVESTVPQGTTFDQACQDVRVEPTGGFYVLWHDGPASKSFLQHYSSSFLTANPAEPQAAVSLVPPPATIGPTLFGDAGEADAGTGMKGFVSATLGTSTGALFLGGLLLVVICYLAVSAAFAALTEKRGLAPAVVGGVAGFGTMIFNTLATIWEAWVGIVLMILTAAVISYYARRLVGIGGSDGGENSE